MSVERDDDQFPEDRLNVVIVDDSMGALLNRRSLLEHHGFNVHSATSLEHAQDLLRLPSVDLLITDVNLNPEDPADTSGIDLAAIARAGHPSLPIVGHSGYISELPEGGATFNFFHQKGQSFDNREAAFDRYVELATEYRKIRRQSRHAEIWTDTWPILRNEFEVLNTYIPDARLLSSGLFVGVASYPQSTLFPKLEGAHSAAKDVWNLCVTALPSASWRLESPSRGDLTRQDLVLILTGFASTLAPGTVSLLYVAAHAVSCAEGLVIAASDYEPKIKFDSGLSLQRILELLSLSSDPSCKFIIILDSCRAGEALKKTHEFDRDRFTLIFTCVQGDTASSLASGTAFSLAFVRAAQSTVGLALQSSHVLNLQDVLRKTRDYLSQNLLTGSLDIQGAGMDSVYLPAPQGPVLPSHATSKNQIGEVEVALITREVDEIERHQAVSELERTLLAWTGYPPALLGHFESVGFTSPGKIRVRLPGPTVALPPSAFLNYLMGRHRNLFYTLSARWHQPVDPKDLAIPSHGTEVIRTGSNFVITWKNGRAKAVGAVEYSQSTTLSLSCISEGQDDLPLDRLLPSLLEFYEKVHHARIRASRI